MRTGGWTSQIFVRIHIHAFCIRPPTWHHVRPIAYPPYSSIHVQLHHIHRSKVWSNTAQDMFLRPPRIRKYSNLSTPFRIDSIWKRRILELLELYQKANLMKKLVKTQLSCQLEIPSRYVGVWKSQDEFSKRVAKRYIDHLAIINFCICLQAAWEGMALTFQFAWFNGGPAALVYGCILSGIGSTAVALALGEMASMCSVSPGSVKHLQTTDLLQDPQRRRTISLVCPLCAASTSFLGLHARLDHNHGLDVQRLCIHVRSLEYGVRTHHLQLSRL